MNPEFWLMIGMLPFCVATTVFAVWRWINARREHAQHEQWRRDWYLTGLYAGRGGALVPRGFGMSEDERMGHRMFGQTQEQAKEKVDEVARDMARNSIPPDDNTAAKVTPNPEKQRPKES